MVSNLLARRLPDVDNRQPVTMPALKLAVGMLTGQHHAHTHFPPPNSLGNLGSCSAPHRLAAIIKNRLKRIQYRPRLIDGFLAQTGIGLEPEPP